MVGSIFGAFWPMNPSENAILGDDAADFAAISSWLRSEFDII